MNRPARIGTALVVCTLLCGCEGGNATPSKDNAQKPAPAGSTVAAATPAQQQPAPVQAKGPFPQSKHEAMKDPAKASETAPETFNVKFDTTVGAFTMSCTRAWAPHGADRFYNLVKIGFFDDVSFFRAVKDFVVQFGIHGDPAVSRVWRSSNIEPDKVTESNKRGYLVYAQAGRPAAEGMTATSRSTQMFLNLKDNDRLDAMGFAPLCKVDDEGMKIVDLIHTGYGEKAGRDQASIQNKGNKYLRERYPKLDYIKTARIDDGKGDAKDGEDGDAKAGDDAKDGAAEADKKADTTTPDAKDAPKADAADNAGKTPAPAEK